LKTLLLTLLLIALPLVTKAQQGAFSIGPMLHLNIGEKPNRLSFGLEAAYWNLEKFPAGLNMGMEFQKGARRFYLEGQVGIGLAGLAFGPVFEKKKDDVIRLGLQTNIWANYFAGINLRWRRINDQKTFAPGIYAKYPFLFGADAENDWSDIFDD